MTKEDPPFTDLASTPPSVDPVRSSVPKATPRSDLRGKVRQVLRDPRTFLGAMVLGYALLFGIVGSLRYWSFATYAWDLGLYNQSIYTTLFSHRFFYYTADLPAGTGGSLFAVHFSPFLFLLFPFYVASPGPATLLFLQSAGVALGALPAYGLAKLKLGSARWGLVVAGAYLLSPVSQGATWYDFHPESFVPAAVLTAFYFLEVRRPREFFVAWFLLLSIIEAIAPFLLLFAGLALLSTYRFQGEKATPQVRQERRWLLTALVIAAAWLGAVVAVISTLGPSTGAFGPNYGVYWSVLGAQSPLDVYPQALLHPTLAFQALSYDAVQKLEYVLILFGAVAFLPWAGEDRYLLPALAWVGLALLSNGPIFYAFGDQYTAYAVPFVIAGAIGGLVVVRDGWRSWAPTPLGARPAPRSLLRHLRALSHPSTRVQTVALAGVLVLGSLVGALLASPLLPSPEDAYPEITYGLPSLTAHDLLAHQVISLIPAGAAVFTTNVLFPEVSSRADAYVLPLSSFFAGSDTFATQVDRYVNASSYVLVDYRIDPFSAEILRAYANLSGFGLRAAEDGTYLYQRGFYGPPSAFVPEATVVVAPSLLTPGSASLAPGNSGPSGPALYHPPGTSAGDEFFSGMNLYPLPPGTYRVTSEVREAGGGNGNTWDDEVLDVPLQISTSVVNPSATGHDYAFSVTEETSEGRAVNTTQLRGSGAGPPVWQNVSIAVDWPRGDAMASEGWISSPTVALWLYQITVEQTSPLA